MKDIFFKIVTMIVCVCSMLSPAICAMGFNDVGEILFYCSAIIAIIMSVIIIVSI